MNFYPCCTTQTHTSMDSESVVNPSRMKERKIMAGMIRYAAEFAFSAFPWIFLVSYMLLSISVSISFMYLTHSQK